MCVLKTKYELISFRSFSKVLGGPARYVRFLRPVIATRGVKIRTLAYGPDFVKATRLGSRNSASARFLGYAFQLTLWL